MRNSLLGITLIVIAVLTWQVHRLPRNPLTVPLYGYLAAQFAFVALGLIALLENDARQYQAIFYLWTVVVGLAMLNLVVRFAFHMEITPLMAWILISGVGEFVLAVFLVLRQSLNHRHMWGALQAMHVSCACFYLGCGIFGLLTLAFPSDAMHDSVRLAVSLLWLFSGAAWLLDAGLYLRARADIVSRIELVPTVVALVILTGLSLFLFTQSEGAVQGTAERVAIERTVAE